MLRDLKFSRKDLLELPIRKWGKTEIYNSILVCKNRKHDSGYASMLIVGLKDYDLNKAEIASRCTDDIHWITNNLLLRTDMHYPSGIIHFWGEGVKFKVGAALSSLDIVLIKVIDRMKEELKYD